MDCRNHPDRLDPALVRPGRFDVQVAFQDATPDQALGLFKHLYPADEFIDQPSEKSSITETQYNELAAQFVHGVFGTGDADDLKVSMAALQGYLLKHKNKPEAAVEGVAEWAKVLWDEQKEREAKRVAKRMVLAAPVSPVSLIEKM